jgi:hypothetical protein
MPDPQAEQAIRDAMTEIAAAGQPTTGDAVRQRAVEVLLEGGASRDDAPERVLEAIADMSGRGELVASDKPWEPWQIKP